jgi:selenium-binding protein 1
MPLELRPSHDPNKTYGFVGVVVSLKDLSASIFTWYRENGKWGVRKTIEIPAEPADPDLLPPALKPFGAVPPLVTDINLSLDDRFLYVSCWGTGDFRQYDVSDPFNPKLTGTVRMGGIVSRTAHPEPPRRGAERRTANGRGQPHGRRVAVTIRCAAWDAQLYPHGIRGWSPTRHAGRRGMSLDPRFFTQMPDGVRPHQVRLEGGDSSSDSYCFAA